MRDHTDVMDLLAAGRPAYFDDPGDLERRRTDLERAISAPLPPGFSSAPSARSGYLRRSHPLVIGIAAAATIAAVTAGSMVVSSKQDSEGSPAGGGLAVATAPKGKFLVLSSEEHHLGPAKLNGKVIKVDSFSESQEWIPRRSEDSGYSVTTSRDVLADAQEREAWKNAGSPTKLATAVPGKGEKKLTFNGTTTIDAAPETQVGRDEAAKTACGTVDECARFPADAEGAVKRYNAIAEKAANWNLQTQKSLEADGDPENGNRPGKPATEAQKAQIVADAKIETIASLLNAPISAKARMAIYRQLETIPGIEKLGPIKDQRGRTGMGYITSVRWDEVMEARMIIDPETGQYLAHELRQKSPDQDPLYTWLEPTDIQQSTVYLGMKWTNATPPKPNVEHADGTD
jgi:hypothetical protein